MQLVKYTLTAPSAVTNSIALAQTLGAPGNLTLNGSSVVAGVAIIGSTTSMAQSMVPVSLTFAADETGHNFTLYGTDYGGNAISEVIAGTTAGTVVSLNFYATITRIAVDSATTGNVSSGVRNVAVSPWVVCDNNKANFQIGFGCSVTGTVNYSIQHTFQDVLSQATSVANQNLFTHEFVVNQTTSQDDNYAFNISAFRLIVNSGTGSVLLASLQAGAGPAF